jgi:hypothetical protein
MPLRRVALCFAVYSLFAVFTGARPVSAQLVVMRMTAQEPATEKLYPRRSLHPTAENQAFTLTPTSSDTIDVSNGDGPFAFTADVKNLRQTATTIAFNRVQQLPCGWTSSVCFGETCFPDGTDSQAYTFDPSSTYELKVNISPVISMVPIDQKISITLSALTGNASDTAHLEIHAVYKPADSAHFFQWASGTVFSKSYTGPKTHPFVVNLANKSCQPALLHFTVQPILPAGWAWKFCFKDTCTTTQNIDYLFAETGVHGDDQQKMTFWITVPDSFSRPDSAIFLLTVRDQNEQLVDSATYRFSMLVKPTAGVNDESSLRAGIVVLNAWPNPIATNSSLNIEIMTDKHGPAEAHIYDMAGLEKASFDLGDLSLGSNRLAISGLRLASGEYIMRLEQDGALSGPVRLNIIH